MFALRLSRPFSKLVHQLSRQNQPLLLTAHLPQPQLLRKQPFMSTSAWPTKQDKPKPQAISTEEWEDMSPEAKIQLDGPGPWGWVVYRCCYAKVFDGIWNDFKLRIQRGLRASILQSDAPGIAEAMDFIFVEDPALEDASIDELQRRFQAWVSEDKGTSGVNTDDPLERRSSHNFFLRVTGEGLCKAHVGLVQGWSVPEEPDPYDDMEIPEREDWMKINIGDVCPYVYNVLEDDEMFYLNYCSPKSGLVGMFH